MSQVRANKLQHNPDETAVLSAWRRAGAGLVHSAGAQLVVPLDPGVLLDGEGGGHGKGAYDTAKARWKDG